MATTAKSDPWKRLAAKRDVQEVELDRALAALAVSPQAASALKRALLERVSRLTEER